VALTEKGAPPDIVHIFSGARSLPAAVAKPTGFFSQFVVEEISTVAIIGRNCGSDGAFRVFSLNWKRGCD
jgi:hypothetical protein